MFFFFNDTATTEIYTLSLHDALPISAGARPAPLPAPGAPRAGRAPPAPRPRAPPARASRGPPAPCPIELAKLEPAALWKSEEHTSELQSPCNLVCRLLLEKKKLHRIY